MTENPYNPNGANPKRMFWQILLLSIVGAVVLVGYRNYVDPNYTGSGYSNGDAIAATSGIAEVLTADQFARKVDGTDDKPVVLFVYASWCPHCNKMFPVVDKAAKAYGNDLEIMAISVDENPEKLERFLGNKGKMHFTPYHLKELNDKRNFSRFLGGKGFTFSGAIPYFAFFYHGKPLAQVPGAMKEDDFNQLIESAIEYGKVEG